MTLTADPDFFAISEILSKSTRRSNGRTIRAGQGAQGSLRCESVNMFGFHNGVMIANALNITIENCKIGHTLPGNPTGIRVQIGDGRNPGGNGVTNSDCHLNSLEEDIVTYAQACLIPRPRLELWHRNRELRHGDGVHTVGRFDHRPGPSERSAQHRWRRKFRNSNADAWVWQRRMEPGVRRTGRKKQYTRRARTTGCLAR